MKDVKEGIKEIIEFMFAFVLLAIFTLLLINIGWGVAEHFKPSPPVPALVKIDKQIELVGKTKITRLFVSFPEEPGIRYEIFNAPTLNQ